MRAPSIVTHWPVCVGGWVRRAGVRVLLGGCEVCAVEGVGWRCCGVAGGVVVDVGVSECVGVCVWEGIV